MHIQSSERNQSTMSYVRLIQLLIMLVNTDCHMQ